MSEEQETTQQPQQSSLKEVKFSLMDLLREADEEKKSSSLAKQLIDQSEIQKAVQDHLKKARHARRKNK
tara:strand:+ start:34883 stop:35089 length:207 start_codon:yes stop_codon:yes gene_type:complete